MKRWLTATGLMGPALVLAQQIGGLSIDRTSIAAGDRIKLVVEFKDVSKEGSIMCGLRVNFGDGDVRDLRVESVPLELTKQYPSAGRYGILVEGQLLVRGLRSALPCPGEDVTALIGVAAPNAAPERPRPPEAASTELASIARDKALGEREKVLDAREKLLNEREKTLNERDTLERERKLRALGVGAESKAPVAGPVPAPAPPSPSRAPAAPSRDRSLDVF